MTVCPHAGLRKTAFPGGVLLLFLLWALPGMVQAQYNYTTNGGFVTIIEYTGTASAVSIPAAIEGLPVAVIGDAAFSGYDNLTSVTIPNSVEIIGNYAFGYCSSLTNVTIPDSVVLIGDGAFSYCTALTGLTIGKGVTGIGSYAFSYCSGLTGATVPDSVVSIGDSAFAFCSLLYGVTMGSSVASIGEWAFRDCPILKRFFVRGNIPSAGVDMFAGADSVTIYYLPGTNWRPTFCGRPTMLYTHDPAFILTIR